MEVAETISVRCCQNTGDVTIITMNPKGSTSILISREQAEIVAECIKKECDSDEVIF